MKKQFTIRFTSGELAGRHFAVQNEGLVIGGSDDADVRCAAAEILAEHVTLLPQLNVNEVLLHPQKSARVAINGKPLADQTDVILRNGDEVKLGKSLQFVLELTETAAFQEYSAASAGDDADTSDATASDTTDAESSAVADAEASVTRYVSEAELSDIRDYTDIQKRKKKMLTIVGVALLLLLIGGLCIYALCSYENTLTWPGVLNQQVADEEYRVTIGKYGDFMIFYPKTPEMVVKKDKNYCEVMSRIGKSKNVPCHWVLQVNTLENGFRIPKEKSFDNWKQKIQTQDGFIISGNPTDEFFSRRGCGIPGYTLLYQRQYNNVTWSGVAIYIRYEDKEIVLLKEVYNRYWERARSLLTGIPCITFSPSMVENYWEVPAKLYSSSLAELSKIVLRELAKDCEQCSWKEISNSLASALCLAHMEENQDEINAFEGMLHLYHRDQTIWFARRCLYFNYCKHYGLSKEMQRIRVESLDRFFDLSDYRYNKICDDDWSL